MGLRIRTIRRHPAMGVVELLVEGHRALRVGADDAAGLEEGQEISSERLDGLKRAHELVHALEMSYKFVRQRPRSLKEIRVHLLKKGIDEGVVERALERLCAEGLADDEAFARFWVGDREAFRPRGIYALRYELKQKGISREISDRVLSAIDEKDSARRAARSRLPALKRASRREFERKMRSFLERRGFSFETAREICEELRSSVDSNDRN